MENKIIQELKGGEDKMNIEKRTVVETIYSDTCPYCNKQIESRYLSQFTYNYRLHLEACKKTVDKASKYNAKQ